MSLILSICVLDFDYNHSKITLSNFTKPTSCDLKEQNEIQTEVIILLLLLSIEDSGF